MSLDGLVDSTGVAMDRLCRACFDGVYPVELPEPELLGKHLLEGLEGLEARLRESGDDAVLDGPARLLGGGGAPDALTRP